MTLGELKAIVDALHEVHGPDLHTNFRYQFASGKVKSGPVTSYRVCPPQGGLHGSVKFSVNHARGDEE